MRVDVCLTKKSGFVFAAAVPTITLLRKAEQRKSSSQSCNFKYQCCCLRPQRKIHTLIRCVDLSDVVVFVVVCPFCASVLVLLCDSPENNLLLCYQRHRQEFTRPFC